MRGKIVCVVAMIGATIGALLAGVDSPWLVALGLAMVSIGFYAIYRTKF